MSKNTKWFKRAVAVILSVCFVVSVTAFAYLGDLSGDVSANSENSETNYIKKEATILKKLGVLTFDDLSKTDTERIVTRAEFADYAAKVFKLAQVTDRIYFSDVNSDNWAFGSINALVEQGAINGTDSGEFLPAENVTFGQACKIVLAAAGYGALIDLMGNSDVLSAYGIYARRIGLDDGVRVGMNDALDFYSAVKLLYNTLFVHSIFSANETGYIEDKTVFSNIFKGYRTYGRLETYFGGSVTGNTVEDEKTVYIDSVEYTIDDDVNAEELFGEEVEAIYTANRKDERQLLYIERKNEKNVLQIESDRISEYNVSEGRIDYWDKKDENRRLNVNIAAGAKIVYNGEVSSKRLSDIFADFADEKTYGAVKLVKSENSSYDLIIVTAYEDFKLSAYNKEENIYYGSSADMSEVKVDEYTNVRVFDSSGNTTTVPEEADSIIAVAPSENKQYIELVSCMNKVSGVVSSVKSTDNKVVVDGTEYELSKQAQQNYDMSALLNSQVKAVLNLEGKIAYMDISSLDEYNLAYATQIAAKDEVFSQTVMIRLYLPDTVELKNICLAEKVRIDGKKYKSENASGIMAAFPGVKTTGTSIKLPHQIIRYTVNSDGLINNIDTCNVGDEEDYNSLIRIYDGTREMKWQASNRRFGMNCIWDSAKTKVIYVPQTNEDGEVKLGTETLEETIDMYKGTMPIWSDNQYYVEGYTLGNNNYYADVIVIRIPTQRDAKNGFMFKKVIDAVDENNDVVQLVVGYNAEGEVKYQCHDDVATMLGDIEAGDIVLPNINSTGTTLMSLEKVFDRGTMTVKNNVADNPYWLYGSMDETAVAWSQKNQLSKTHVYSVKGGIVRSTYDFYDMSKDIYNETTLVSALPIVVFDESKRKDVVTRGSVSDIRAYDISGENCSTIVVHSGSAANRVVFVYNGCNVR